MARPEYTPQERIDMIQQLRQKMVENHHCAANICEQIGVVPQTINTWLRGENLPRLSKIQNILDYIHDRPKQTATPIEKMEVDICLVSEQIYEIDQKINKIMKELGL